MWMVRSIPAPALPPPPVAGQAAVSPLRAALQSNAQRGLHSRPCTKLPCSHRLESKVGRDSGSWAKISPAKMAERDAHLASALGLWSKTSNLKDTGA